MWKIGKHNNKYLIKLIKSDILDSDLVKQNLVKNVLFKNIIFITYVVSTEILLSFFNNDWLDTLKSL